MNPAINAALIAAAAKQDSEQGIEGRLRAAGATDATNATAFVPENDTEQQLLDQAVAGGTVARTADGLVYLDERAIADRKQGQGFMVMLILLISASLIASGAALVIFTKGLED